MMLCSDRFRFDVMRRVRIVALVVSMFTVASGVVRADTYLPVLEWSVGTATSVNTSTFFSYTVWVKDMDTIFYMGQNVEVADYQMTVSLVTARSANNVTFNQISYENNKKTFEFSGTSQATAETYLDDFKFHDGRSDFDARRDSPVEASHTVNVTAP